MIYQCPGAANIRTPSIKIKKCPNCGGEVELFSIDMKVDCPGCGRPVYNNVNSCVRYCKYAEQCLGSDAYQKARQADKKEVQK
jgi:hypothetical protein